MKRVTIFTDGAADSLTGAAGQDWFFAAAEDKSDRSGAEAVN